MGFFRNLTSSEIILQFYLANEIVREEGRRISHIVFMGMGEPLDNYDNVVSACKILLGKNELALSPRKVTLSTSGLADKIKQLSQELPISLAISLHACNDELELLLCLSIVSSLYQRLKKACFLINEKETGSLITIEYILIKNKNCDIKHAKELVRYLHGLRVKVNLIPFNSHPGSEWGGLKSL